MSNMREISAQMKAIAVVVRDHVAKTFAILAGRLDSLETQIKNLPAPKDGASVTIDDVRPLIDAAVKAIPAPQNGKDADPEIIRQMVDEAVAALPPPKDGLSVTVDDVRPVIDDAVKAAVAALPAPKDGRDYDPDVLHAAVKAAVSESVKAIPAPEDGKSVSLEDLRPVVDEAVKQLRLDADEVFRETLEQAGQIRDDLSKSLGELRQPEDGKSVTVEDVQPLIVDEVAKAVATIPTPKDGESVPVEQVQQMIDKAVGVAVSKAISALPKPADGRDACDIEILPAIDEDKSYPRGAYATHAGGLWRAYQATDGMKGWECIVDGIDDIEVTFHGDPRQGHIALRKSSGDATDVPFSIPAMVYRGVYRPGENYARGDTVTWNGAVWHCNESTQENPDNSKSWNLAVKRGDKGADAFQSAKRNKMPGTDGTERQWLEHIYTGKNPDRVVKL